MSRVFIFLGAVFAASAVAAGAIGAHMLESRLAAKQLTTFHTAVDYQLAHAIGLIVVGLMGVCWKRNGTVRFAGWLLLLGIVLFSGCLFAWISTGLKFFVYPVPVGGTAFIVGWLVLAVAACRGPSDS